jgi:RimJ/RimL family protein N-acetyltransferase
VSTLRPDERILTDRLDLRPVAVDDADEIAAIFADRRLYAFTGGEPSAMEALRSTFARLAADRSASSTAQLNWVVRHRVDARPIGMLQAIFTDGGHAAEIAWVIGVPWQGQGIATEAARAVVNWLHSQGVRTITAWIRPDHHASAAVARRAGLTATGGNRDTERHPEQLWRLQVQKASTAQGLGRSRVVIDAGVQVPSLPRVDPESLHHPSAVAGA